MSKASRPVLVSGFPPARLTVPFASRRAPARWTNMASGWRVRMVQSRVSISLAPNGLWRLRAPSGTEGRLVEPGHGDAAVTEPARVAQPRRDTALRRHGRPRRADRFEFVLLDRTGGKVDPCDQHRSGGHQVGRPGVRVDRQPGSAEAPASATALVAAGPDSRDFDRPQLAVDAGMQDPGRTDPPIRGY